MLSSLSLLGVYLLVDQLCFQFGVRPFWHILARMSVSFRIISILELDLIPQHFNVGEKKDDFLQLEFG